MSTAVQLPFIVREQLQQVSRSSAPVHIRLLRAAEAIPNVLDAAFDKLDKIDPYWVWIAEQSGEMIAILITAPCHGVVMLWRLCALPTAPATTFVRLFRRALHDMKLRGYVGYVVCLDLDNEAENKLSKIILHAGGGIFGKGVIMAGRTDIGDL